MPGPDPQLAEIRERVAIRDIVRLYPHGGNHLEAALRAAYRRGRADADVLPTPSKPSSA